MNKEQDELSNAWIALKRIVTAANQHDLEEVAKAIKETIDDFNDQCFDACAHVINLIDSWIEDNKETLTILSKAYESVPERKVSFPAAIRYEILRKMLESK